jgi:hypothetical protein
VKYVRDQLIMLPHTYVNWRPYESVRHLLPICVDDCVDIDAILDSTGDSETAPTPSTPHPPHFPYENADFTSILDNVSTVYLNLKF